MKSTLKRLLNKPPDGYWARLLPYMGRADIGKLSRLPRHQPATIQWQGHTLHVPDALSFKYAAYEIFHKQSYRFQSPTAAPYIIDCGANIGLSVLYFAQQYPQARIVAFEADPQVFEVLQQNVAAAGLQGRVELVQAAVWDKKEPLTFYAEGADAGSVSATVGRQATQVQAVPLADWLGQPVDMLKMDIEGAEVRVLLAAEEQLKQVKNLFVEYHSLADSEQALPELLHLLRGAGFRMYIEHNGPVSASPLIARPLSLGFDCLLNIFAYRP